MDHRKLHERLAAGRRRLVILAQSPAPARPREGPLHNPPTRQDDEPFGIIRPLDDLQPQPVTPTKVIDPSDRGAGVASVGPDQPQPAEAVPQRGRRELGPITILDVGRVDHRQDQHERVDHDVPLAARDLLTGVIAARPPFSVVLTDWRSRIAAEGCRCRPSAWRRSPRSSSCRRSSVPSFFQSMKYQYTARHGGRSCGMARHWQPVRATYSKASVISRRSYSAGCPPVLGAGMKRETWAYWGPGKSEG